MSNSCKHKKIALYAPNLAGGGAERVISNLAAGFSKKGYEVDLLLVKAVGPYLADIPELVRVIDLGCSRTLFSLPKLVNYLRAEKPDVLFSSLMHSSTIALWASKLAGVKTRVFIRQPNMLMPSHEVETFASKIRKKIFLKTAVLAEKVIVTSEMMAKEFQLCSRISKHKIEIIHNPVSLDNIKEKSQIFIDHPWLKEGEPPVILAVGRLVVAKDFYTLIKAFAIVQEVTPARLIILGEGELRGELEQLIKKLGVDEKVKMPGFVANPYQYMNHAKVFALSSLWEGFPNGLIEALICDMAVVSTDCEGGASEILEQGKWGELVPVANEELMAKSIIKVLTGKNLPNFSERKESFSVSSVCEKYINIFGM